MERVRPWDPDEVICPNCGHTFRAVPATAQEIFVRQREEIAALRTAKAIVERSNRIVCDLAEAMLESLTTTGRPHHTAEEMQIASALMSAIARARVPLL